MKVFMPIVNLENSQHVNNKELTAGKFTSGQASKKRSKSYNEQGLSKTFLCGM